MRRIEQRFAQTRKKAASNPGLADWMREKATDPNE
jgi:hypothetical protein